MGYNGVPCIHGLKRKSKINHSKGLYTFYTFSPILDNYKWIYNSSSHNDTSGLT